MIKLIRLEWKKNNFKEYSKCGDNDSCPSGIYADDSAGTGDAGDSGDVRKRDTGQFRSAPCPYVVHRFYRRNDCGIYCGCL